MCSQRMANDIIVHFLRRSSRAFTCAEGTVYVCTKLNDRSEIKSKKMQTNLCDEPIIPVQRRAQFSRQFRFGGNQESHFRESRPHPSFLDARLRAAVRRRLVDGNGTRDDLHEPFRFSGFDASTETPARQLAFADMKARVHFFRMLDFGKLDFGKLDFFGK